MLAKTIKSNQILVLVIIMLIGFALWFFTLTKPVLFPSQTSYMPFYSAVLSVFGNNTFLIKLFTFILVIIQGLLLVGFNKKFILIANRTYLPAFFFILISSSFIPAQQINPIILGIFFVFLSMDFIFRTYRVEYALNEIYISGFFIAFASLFWASYLYFLILLFISLIILRTFSLREWIVALLGFLTPLFFVFVIYYVFIPEETGIKLYNYIISELFVKERFITFDLSYILFYSFLSLLLILASLKIIGSYQNKKIKTRKYFEINWWLFITGLVIFLLLKRNTMGIIYILSIPLSFLLTDYFYSIRKNWYLNLILVCIYGGLIYIQLKAHF
jgi:hypothetical protein